MANDLSGIIPNTGVALEAAALKQFGSAVEGNSIGSLSKSFKLPTAAASPTGESSEPTSANVWDTTKYAAALVHTAQEEFNPKLKFLFKVTFEFDPAMIDAAWALGHDLKKIQESATFLVRNVDRPKFDYEFEDVNLYNFRTKVLKSIKHREVGVTMYDDVGNNALSFINAVLKLQMPIARYEQNPSLNLEDFGFEFDQTLEAIDTAMRGPLPGDRRNIFQKMTIHQIFVARGSEDPNPASWVRCVNFVFTNPRFTNIDIDDMDHENGANFNLITCTLDFDTMFIAAPIVFDANSTPSLGTGDILGNNQGGTPAANAVSGAAGGGAGGTPSRDTKRTSSTPTMNLLNKTLGISAGGGKQLSPSSILGNSTVFPNASSFVKDSSVPSALIPNLSSKFGGNLVTYMNNNPGVPVVPADPTNFNGG